MLLLACAPLVCTFSFSPGTALPHSHAPPGTALPHSHARAGSVSLNTAAATILGSALLHMRILPQRIPVRGTELKYEKAYVAHYSRVLRRAVRMERRKLRKCHEDEARATTAVATLFRVLQDAHTAQHSGLRRQYEHSLEQHELTLCECRAERTKHQRLLGQLLQQQHVVLRERYATQIDSLFADEEQLAALRRQAAFDDFD
jgi:hypothetical protein